MTIKKAIHIKGEILMKKIIALIFSISSLAFASDIKVTSFSFLDHSAHFSPGAEFCGELVAPTGKPEMIKIVSDPGMKDPAQYFAWAGPEGKFCTIIATYTGKAEAILIEK